MVKNLDQTERKKINHESAENAFMKVLVSEKEGWEDHVMRVVEVEEDGFTPRHKHPWPHINYVVEGQGVIMIDGKDHLVKTGDYAFIPNDTLHQFKNRGKETFKFICIVPKVGHQ